MTVSIEKWFDGHKCWETTAVSSVVAARQQLQSIKSEIMQSKIYCVFKDTPNEFFYRNENARDIKYRIVKYFTKQPLWNRKQITNGGISTRTIVVRNFAKYK